MKLHRCLTSMALSLLALQVHAQSFSLTTSAFENGGRLSAQQVFNGFGCEGANQSPVLQWSGVPEGTRSLVLTVYDPDAPTGSGWWHWVVYDIPAHVRELPANAGAAKSSTLPSGAKQGRNDYGSQSFGGACPPVGDAPHHYIFTLYALKVDHLAVPADASSALIGFMTRANAIGTAVTTATYGR